VPDATGLRSKVKLRHYKTGVVFMDPGVNRDGGAGVRLR